MDDGRARAFLAVAEHLHFGRAAEHLHVAQPALSRTIAALEREVGTRLFVRDTRNVSLTASGAALLGPARRLVNAADEARLAVRAAGRGEYGRVRLAYSGASTHELVGTLAQRIRRDHPGIALDLSSSSFANETVSLVLRGDADIGLGRWDFAPAGAATMTVATERLVVAVPLHHPLSTRASVRIAELSADAWVSLPEHDGSVLGQRLRELSMAVGFIPQTVQFAPDSWTLMTLVGAGIGCSLTVSSVADNVHHPGVRYLRLADPVPAIRLRMVWRYDETHPAAVRVISLAQALWRQAHACKSPKLPATDPGPQ